MITHTILATGIPNIEGNLLLGLLMFVGAVGALVFAGFGVLRSGVILLLTRQRLPRRDVVSHALRAGLGALAILGIGVCSQNVLFLAAGAALLLLAAAGITTAWIRRLTGERVMQGGLAR